MFLNFFKLTKTIKNFGASRNSFFFLNKFSAQNKAKKLSLKLKWKGGRGSGGKILFRTRGGLNRKYKTIKVNYSLRYHKLNFISTFQFVPFKNKILTLVFFSNGSFNYFICTSEHTLFSYSYFNMKKKINKYTVTSYWLPVFLVKKLSYLCFIETLPNKKAQLCLSSGTKAKLFNIDYSSKTALIILPSKEKKTISQFSCVLVGQVSLQDKKNFKNGKSGYWRRFGIKPIVRGVAMNPVDHPHGGRTKAIRYQRTPWGKTTKYK